MFTAVVVTSEFRMIIILLLFGEKKKSSTFHFKCMWKWKVFIFITLRVLICVCRAWPRANTLLYTSHPTSCGDIITRHNLPSVGFQRSFHPFCECLSGPHRVSDSSFTGFTSSKSINVFSCQSERNCSPALFEVLSSFTYFMRWIFTETPNYRLSNVMRQYLISRTAARAVGVILLIW